MTSDIRAVVAHDIDHIKDLAVRNGMFAPEEMDGFDHVLRGYLHGTLDGHKWIVAVSKAGELDGAAYHASEPFGDRVWNLCFIAVRPERQREGIGTLLLGHVEQTLRSLGESQARVLIVETSSTDAYAAARRFYGREGFDHEATIREFYGPGDDKLVYWKMLT